MFAAANQGGGGSGQINNQAAQGIIQGSTGEINQAQAGKKYRST
jgi:hypothetical protein